VQLAKDDKKNFASFAKVFISNIQLFLQFQFYFIRLMMQIKRCWWGSKQGQYKILSNCWKVHLYRVHI